MRLIDLPENMNKRHQLETNLQHLVESHLKKAEDCKTTESFIRNNAKARAYKNCLWLIKSIGE